MSTQFLPQFIRDNYEIHEWRHACAILKEDFNSEFQDICDVLCRFRQLKSHIAVGGGRKSKVAEWIDSELYGKGWRETNFDTKITVDGRDMESATDSVDCNK